MEIVPPWQEKKLGEIETDKKRKPDKKDVHVGRKKRRIEDLLKVPIKDQITQEDTWCVLDSYFRQNGFAKHQIDSFNKYINTGLQDIVTQTGDIDVKYEAPVDSGRTGVRYVIKFGKEYISRPSVTEKDGEITFVTPQQCLLRRLTYYSNFYVDIIQTIYVYTTFLL